MSTLEHKPFVSARTIMPEFGVGPVLLGVVLGILFGASSLYLGLKVGMTVSASVPIAVMSITLFKAFSRMTGFRNATILENNMVQTTGSAGESIAFGISVTMPALLILGYDMDFFRVASAAVLGSVLGVLMMIPLRKALIEDEHGNLPYPEGTACAEVLIAGEKGGSTAKTVFGGFFAGLVYKVSNAGLKLWKEEVGHKFASFKGASVGAEVSPEMLGVGYIIGPKNGCIMIAGAILSSWVLIPMISFFGAGWSSPLFPGKKLISEMSIHEIWGAYILYIGAGAVTTGGIIALVRSMPMIIKGAKSGFVSVQQSAKSRKQKSGAKSLEESEQIRTSRDLPMSIVVIGSLLIVTAISLIPGFHMNLLGAVMIVMFGFLFVTVSSRLTGEIGSSSNPISGMTVATLLFTSLIFLLLGWTGLEFRVTALSVAAIVCVAASNAGTTSQDLKTGFLLGATPRYQQLGLLAGAITSSLVIGYTLNILNDASTVYTNKVPMGIVGDLEKLTESSAVRDPAHKDDTQIYKILRIREDSSLNPPAMGALVPGKYLVHPTTGAVSYFVDPGINGSLKERDDGTTVQKFEAPKARLMSLIIDGILTQKLPWTLVLLGASIAIFMELCGIASLPFAVGVYLPMSTSAPIFFGGLVRGLVDMLNRKGKASTLDSEAGPGILFSSGLIAGGSIAGILLALLAMSGTGWDFSGIFPAFSLSEWGATLMFSVMMIAMFRVARVARE
ncbi:MAG: oligopeptide transporter, OPT family [Proteobacteria bacterium]|nr:oligopeptide transporter, OPT family [Pseudomonadota bacterium]